MTQVRGYKYRLRPNKAQADALSTMLSDFCGLYNACLQQRQEAYGRQRKALRYFDQAAELKACRDADPDGLGRWSYSALQQVLRRVDQTYKAFYRRGKGFPRFRAQARFNSALFRVNAGFTIKPDLRVAFVGVPSTIKVVWHRALPAGAKLSTAVVIHKAGNWFLVVAAEDDFSEACGLGSVGIDLGLNSLIATSDGEAVETPRFARKAQKAQRRRQRALARCRRGSKRRLKAKARLAAGSAKIARQRRDHLHKLSRSLVSRYQGIAFENLNMAGLKRGMLARPIHDAAWSLLVQLVQYKAASAGAEVVMVDPRGTSQTCPNCGTIKPKKLSERTHRCDCGSVLDRDVAAAKIVHQRAFGSGPGHGLRTPSQRVAA